MGNMEKMVLCLITSVFSSMRCHQLRVGVGGKGTEALGEKIWDCNLLNRKQTYFLLEVKVPINMSVT